MFYETARKKTRHLLTYVEAEKIKSLTLHTHGWLGGLLKGPIFFSSCFIIYDSPSTAEPQPLKHLQPNSPAADVALRVGTSWRTIITGCCWSSSIPRSRVMRCCRLMKSACSGQMHFKTSSMHDSILSNWCFPSSGIVFRVCIWQKYGDLIVAIDEIVAYKIVIE